jgi:3-oxoacyl-[acyl-carrier-protein] synthase-1
MKVTKWIHILPNKVVLNGKEIPFKTTGSELLTTIYRKQINDYPKFFKMDALCKLGFVASELLLADETNRFAPREDRAIIFFNRSGSLCDDENYQQTIQDKNNYYPSPAIFVYTLPNIVTGEIAIRNKYLGETSFYVLDELNEATIETTINAAFQDEMTHSVLGGWLECENKDLYEARLFIAEQD